jgi:hypothetical protein
MLTRIALKSFIEEDEETEDGDEWPNNPK